MGKEALNVIKIFQACHFLELAGQSWDSFID